jgi:multimeric flavodoxin WrbA
MPRKSFILYSSITGNTEKVALRFKKVFESKGWQCDSLKINRKTNLKEIPYKLEDYDIICVGSPILAGLPTREMQDAIGPGVLFRKFPGFPHIDEGYGQKKGIVFVTYGGFGRGPEEAIPTLALLKMKLEDIKIKCIGKFACPGKEFRHVAVDTVAQKQKLSVEDASGTLARYAENPNSAEFSNFSKEERNVFEKALADNREVQIGSERSNMWHWDVQRRPGERDLLKAQIFMEEILEDYYEGGLEAAPVAEYLCIA